MAEVMEYDLLRMYIKSWLGHYSVFLKQLCTNIKHLEMNFLLQMAKSDVLVSIYLASLS